MKRAPSCYGAERDHEPDEGLQAVRILLFLFIAWVALIAGWQASKLIWKPEAAQAADRSNTEAAEVAEKAR